MSGHRRLQRGCGLHRARRHQQWLLGGDEHGSGVYVRRRHQRRGPGPRSATITSAEATPNGAGYWIVTALGKVSPYNAPDDGDMSGTHLNGPIVAASGS